MNFASPKATLRTKMKAQLNALTPQHRAAESQRAGLLLERQPIWQRVRTILFFGPLTDEPDLWPMLLKALSIGKTVVLPRYSPGTNQYAAAVIRDPDADLRIGRFGIREPGPNCPPVSLEQLELVLVPGVAFDLTGHRLGRGRGFYDKLLPQVRGSTCGVAFEEQIVEKIPAEAHDVRLNCILTPTRWVEIQ